MALLNQVIERAQASDMDRFRPLGDMPARAGRWPARQVQRLHPTENAMFARCWPLSAVLSQCARFITPQRRKHWRLRAVMQPAKMHASLYCQVCLIVQQPGKSVVLPEDQRAVEKVAFVYSPLASSHESVTCSTTSVSKPR